MILSGKTIERLEIIQPFSPRTKRFGKSYGVSVAGYDVRSANELILHPGESGLTITMEKFKMPKNVVGFLHPKSTWARDFVWVPTVVIEPGWEGYLTVAVSNLNQDANAIIRVGEPLAQVVFHFTDEETEGYTGKYQNAPKLPQAAIFEAA